MIMSLTDFVSTSSIRLDKSGVRKYQVGDTGAGTGLQRAVIDRAGRPSKRKLNWSAPRIQFRAENPDSEWGTSTISTIVLVTLGEISQCRRMKSNFKTGFRSQEKTS